MLVTLYIIIKNEIILLMNDTTSNLSYTDMQAGREPKTMAKRVIMGTVAAAMPGERPPAQSNAFARSQRKIWCIRYSMGCKGSKTHSPDIAFAMSSFAETGKRSPWSREEEALLKQAKILCSLPVRLYTDFILCFLTRIPFHIIFIKV